MPSGVEKNLETKEVAKRNQIRHQEFITKMLLHKVNELRIITSNDHIINTKKKKCRCSISPASKFVLRVTGQNGNARKRHKDYTGSGQMSLRPGRALVFLHLVCTNGLQRTREGNELPSLWVAWAWVWVCKRSIPHSGGCPLPFIVQGREGPIQKVKREKTRGSDAA